MLITDLLRRLARGLFLAAVGALTLIHSPVEAADAPGGYGPVADARAVVTTAHARFTILTPQLIRMEWSTNGKFEDHASLVFLNRRFSVPEFKRETGPDGSAMIRTSALTLVYAPNKSDGKFTAENLSISFNLGDKKTVWK